MKHRKSREFPRRGNVLALVVLFLVSLMTVVAFAVDYGFLLVSRTNMQRAADAAALAAVRELTPNEAGNQTGAADAAREVARAYVNTNLPSIDFQISDEDIEVGRYDRATINSGNVKILNEGIQDTVRVTLRRDSNNNGAIAMYFGRVVGVDQVDMVVSATAVLRPARVLVPGNAVLPIAVDEKEWDEMDPGQSLKIFGDGRVENAEGEIIAGNWGTVDIGNTGNSTSDISDQIEHGLRQTDLDFMASDPGPSGMRIPTHEEVPPGIWLQGETGLSAGLQHSLDVAIGKIRIVPIVDKVSGGGGNTAEYHVVRWGVVEVRAADLTGSQATKHVIVGKKYAYDGSLRPILDLSDNTAIIDGAFASAGLVE